jgi:hypothetical protein
MTIQGIAQQTARTTASGTGYLEYLPPDYSTNPTKKYPLLIFLHGTGETGNGSVADLERVKTNGPPKLIQGGNNMCFTVNGVQECFIVISPQLDPNVGGWWPSILQPIFDHVLNGSQNYRIDKTRVYLTGLSLGGQGVYIGLGETTDVFAAGAVVAGFNNGNGCTISSRKIPVWGFHGENDGTILYSNGLNEFNKIGSCTTPTPTSELKWTNYPGVGHNAWDNAYTTDHSIQSPLNLYEWLLTKSKNLTGTGNASPTANAGTDQIITLPSNALNLNGSGADSDGTITTYAWAKVSGIAATLANANTNVLSLSGLAAGTYVFRLTVTDNGGATAVDDVTVVVNIAPAANAGTDQALTLPTNAVTIAGDGVDPDGTISSYAWTKVSSLPATLANANTNTLNLTGLATGSHVVRLTVTDNLGATASDEVNVIVNPSNNLALNKPVATSSNENTSMTGAKAVDGNTTTRWSSQFSDPQWLYIDLGSNVNINRVKITWETAAASNYKIQTSSDAATWTDIKTITGNTTLSNDHTGLIGSGRYVRMYGTTRKTIYGYSIYEFEVYGSVGNTAPIANAGADQTITLPVSSLNLTGSGTDSDGTISSYTWTKVSGLAATLTNANTSTLSLSGLISGAYVFRLTATDNSGATASDDVNVTVNPAPNVAPTANAGADQTITLPINSLTLVGSGTDSDGIIASYAWTKVSGPAATLANEATAMLSLTGLISGSYVFRLAVTDNLSATASDDVNVTVNSAPNVAPTANAGADQTITLPTNSFSLAGSGADSDGTIASYAWTKVSGPTAILTNANTSTVNLSGLTAGSYIFRLAVTDNLSATASDDVNVTVNSAPSNLAPSKPVFTSSNEGWATTGAQAVDGSTTTRWSSQFSDPQWIYVDLGSNININRVKIVWEAAKAASYKIQTSGDAIAWTDIKTITGNSALINDHIGLSGSGRYVRMLGLTRGTIYGYSIYELEVYGDVIPSAPANARSSTTASENTGTATSSISTNEVIGLTFLDKTYLGESNYSIAIYNSNGVNIFNGKWDTQLYHDIFSEGGLYYYHVLKTGKRIDSGKVFIMDK